MPSNSTVGTPYPLPTDPVTDGANAIKNVVDTVDKRPLGMLVSAAKVLTVTATTNSSVMQNSGTFDLPGASATGRRNLLATFIVTLRTDTAANTAGITLRLGGSTLVIYIDHQIEHTGAAGEIKVSAAGQINYPSGLGKTWEILIRKSQGATGNVQMMESQVCITDVGGTL